MKRNMQGVALVKPALLNKFPQQGHRDDMIKKRANKGAGSAPIRHASSAGTQARRMRALPGLAVLWLAVGAAAAQNSPARAGGTLVLAHTSEPKTLNPLLAADQPTRDILY